MLTDRDTEGRAHGRGWTDRYTEAADVIIFMIDETGDETELSQN